MRPTRVVHGQEDFDVDIAFGKWANPSYVPGRKVRRADPQRYWNWLREQPHLMSALPELQGKRLRCPCSSVYCYGARLADEVNDLTQRPYGFYWVRRYEGAALEVAEFSYGEWSCVGFEESFPDAYFVWIGNTPIPPGTYRSEGD